MKTMSKQDVNSIKLAPVINCQKNIPVIEQFLLLQRNLVHGSLQEAFVNKVLDSLKFVHITKVSDLPTDLKELLTSIAIASHPVPRECYKSAAQFTLSSYGALEVLYVEGYYQIHGFPVEHAFNAVTINKSDGTKNKFYVDITAEFALKDITPQEYAVVKEYTRNELFTLLNERKEYTQFYNDIFNNEIKGNVKGL